MGKIATCKNCKKEKEIISKGLCRACYDSLRHVERKPAPKPKETPVPKVAAAAADNAPAPQQVISSHSLLSLITPPLEVKTEGIFLDFSARPGLLVDLEALSDNVPGDILELCSMLVSGKLRMVA